MVFVTVIGLGLRAEIKLFINQKQMQRYYSNEELNMDL